MIPGSDLETLRAELARFIARTEEAMDTAGTDVLGLNHCGRRYFIGNRHAEAEADRRIAPRVEDWPLLVEQLTTLLKIDYDWTGDVEKLQMPVMIVAGDADGLPPSHAVEFFGLLGGGGATPTGTAQE